MNEKDKKDPDVNKALEVLFAGDYLDKRKLYKANFVRGIVFGAGSAIGATVVLIILLWILSLFDTVPLIGPVVEHVTETIQSR